MIEMLLEIKNQNEKEKNMFETVQIPVTRLEKFIRAEVRLEIIMKALEQDGYISSSELKRILDMEVLSNGDK